MPAMKSVGKKTSKKTGEYKVTIHTSDGKSAGLDSPEAEELIRDTFFKKETMKAEAKEKKADTIRKEKIQIILPCELTKDELAESATKMAAAWAEKARFDDELKTVKTQMQSQITRAESEINLYAERVRSKTESRQVECEIVTDYDAKTKNVIRLDTMKVVSSRTLTTGELQMGLKLDVKTAEKPPQTEAENQAAIDTLDDGEIN